MAELDTSSSGGGKHKGGKRAKKMSTRVDLTAMVDLGFLLITFFMLTTTFNKPKTMELNMPNKDEEHKDNEPVPESRTITILLAKDTVFWYNGLGTRPEDKAEISNYSDKGIRQVLIDKTKAVKTVTPDKDLIILIKPLDKSLYKNTVDILDEMAIIDAKIYAIVEVSDNDRKLIEKAKGK